MKAADAAAAAAAAAAAISTVGVRATAVTSAGGSTGATNAATSYIGVSPSEETPQCRQILLLIREEAATQSGREIFESVQPNRDGKIQHQQVCDLGPGKNCTTLRAGVSDLRKYVSWKIHISNVSGMPFQTSTTRLRC